MRYNFHCFSVFQQSSCTCFCYSSDKFGILLEFDVVVALILHQHHLQIDVIANLEPPHTSICLLIQGHCCSYIAGGQTHCKEQIFDVLVLMNCTSLFLYRHTNMTFWLVCYHLFNNKPAMPFCIMPFCFEVTKSEFMYSTCSDQRNSATCFKSPYLNLMLKMYLKEKFIFLITTWCIHTHTILYWPLPQQVVIDEDEETFLPHLSLLLILLDSNKNSSNKRTKGEFKWSCYMRKNYQIILFNLSQVSWRTDMV